MASTGVGGGLACRYRGSSGPSSRRPRFISTIPLRIQLDDGHRRLIDDPQIVILVESHGVRVGQAVYAMGDFAHEITLFVVFENVRGGVAVDWAARRGCPRVVQNHDVPFGIHRNGKHLTQVPIGSDLQERHGFVWKIRNVLLRDRRPCQQHEHSNHQEPFHRASKKLQFAI